MSMLRRARGVIDRVATRIGGWLPPIPSDDPGPPDVDGKRPSEVGSQDVIRVQANQKNGKGGFR